MNSENNNENCEENIKKKRREIKVPNFIKKIFDYYKNWNGIGIILIAIVCIISVFVITKNSFRLNGTFASIDKNSYERLSYRKLLTRLSRHHNSPVDEKLNVLNENALQEIISGNYYIIQNRGSRKFLLQKRDEQ